jgi:hypothetical protein
VPKPTVEETGARVRTEAQTDWDQGYTWHLLTIDGSENTAYLIQWVENVGWRLEHAGWVWAEKGYIGYGGFGMQNNGILGNFLFRRPADKPVPSRADVQERR